MNGINIMLKYATMNDCRWDVKKYDYTDLVSSLSDSDKAIIKDLDCIGDGELNGLAMGAYAMKKVFEAQSSKKKKKLMNDWAEILMYTQGVIVYDEFRHGVVLKELYSLVVNGTSWKATATPENLMKYFLGKDIWDNEYELLVSLFMGEITNTALYNAVGTYIENVDFKNIVKCIEKDESRHRAAWFELTKKLISTNKKHKKKYIEAFKKVHAMHQAEVGETFVEGIRHTQKYLTSAVTSKIETERYELMKKLLGEDMPFTQIEMTRAHTLHNYNLIEQSKRGQ
jgi:rubrerythrin